MWRRVLQGPYDEKFLFLFLRFCCWNFAFGLTRTPPGVSLLRIIEAKVCGRKQRQCIIVASFILWFWTVKKTRFCLTHWLILFQSDAFVRLSSLFSFFFFFARREWRFHHLDRRFIARQSNRAIPILFVFFILRCGVQARISYLTRNICEPPQNSPCEM